ncbi:MAG: glucose-1-phosphate adenylyltransferase [bacterium]|nr:MAG: glucose-1-phosphate adenylyltransferase [bacterium]
MREQAVKTVALILAGGIGKRLSLLTRYRAKPAVQFAGSYRIIDFTMTNCVRSGIDNIFILTQYISRSLSRHIGIGKPWDLDRAYGGVHLLHPHLGYQAADWYQGTADAIYQNITVLRELDCDLVMILSGDHVYRMDYREFIDFHVACGLPASVGVVEVPRSLCREFGIATIGTHAKIVRFQEKPVRSKSNLASMGIYIFDRSFLIRTLAEFKRFHDDLDFGKHVIPRLVQRRLVSAHRFAGYWLDIGTLKSYFSASLGLLADRPRLKLHDPENPILTVPDDNPPVVVDSRANVRRSLVSNGCVIRGDVTSSILSPGVVVGRDARIERSIIFSECIIEPGAFVKDTIIDKQCRIGRNTTIGLGNRAIPNQRQPSYLDFGLTLIGRKTDIPAGLHIGTNCLVCGSPAHGRIPKKDIGDGGYSVAGDSGL